MENGTLFSFSGFVAYEFVHPQFANRSVLEVDLNYDLAVQGLDEIPQGAEENVARLAFYLRHGRLFDAEYFSQLDLSKATLGPKFLQCALRR